MTTQPININVYLIMLIIYAKIDPVKLLLYQDHLILFNHQLLIIVITIDLKEIVALME